jgi:hypothetical protein
MSDRINISYCANAIATELHGALRTRRLPKIGIDEITAAIVGYLAACPHFASELDIERLIEATTRKVVEKVG